MDIERNVLALQQSVLAYTQTGYVGVVSRVERLIATLNDQLQKIEITENNKKSQDTLRRMVGHFKNYSQHFNMALEARQHRDTMVNNQLNRRVNEISPTLTLLISRFREQKDLDSASLAGIAQEKILLAHQNFLNFLNKPRSYHVRNNHQYFTDLHDVLHELSIRLQDVQKMDEHRQVIKIMEIASSYEKYFMEVVQVTRGYLNLVYVVMAGEAWEFAYLANELKTITKLNRDEVQRDMTATINDTQQIGLVVSIIQPQHCGQLCFLLHG